jgi:glucose-6-phosphate isomerase
MSKENIWSLLEIARNELASSHLKDFFAEDATRFSKFSLEAAGLFLDYSKQYILPETFNLLCRLAQEADIVGRREAMFSGKAINVTEQRAVLHTALRDLSDKPIMVDGVNVKPQITEVFVRVEQCVQKIRDGKWLGYDGRAIKTIVNIGIGGSDLGPAMAVMALTPYTLRDLEYYFVSNIDATHISEVLRKCDPATTLFVVASKTFTTQETLCNANTAKKWLLQKCDNAETAIQHHFIAVTAKPERAKEFGVASTNIYPFWDWVGGRYSVWSAIGLSLAIAIGMDNFRSFLAGAHAMDEHFYTQPLATNMPIIMAVLGIWNINFWQCATQAVIPYDQYLSLLPSYLQQLDMESNGKHVRIDGTNISYKTAPVLWGGVGTNGQHAFHQLLLQGTQTVPVDFIIAAQSHNDIDSHHELLVANCFAQSQALMRGKNQTEIIDELIEQGFAPDDAKTLAPHKVIVGNVPSNTIMLSKLTPYSLGALLALYEHKVFVQGIIWGINSFDQWGVELGKQLANKIALQLQVNMLSEVDMTLDSSILGLIQRYRNEKK